MRRTLIAGTVIALVSSFASGVVPMPNAEAKSSAMVTGLWGGRQIRLQANADGATIDFDCAHGRISGPIKLDKGGRFSTKGSYEAFSPGPQQADAPVETTARFSGRVSGDTLTLDIIAAPGNPKRSYTLTRGKMSKIIRCY